jgi:glycosyltransferase involved in cell wall biosynthesis
MPLYNAERYLSETLESVRAQTFPDWEIVAYAGTSTDRTIAILEEYHKKDPRISFRSGPSPSPYFAIFEAAAMARGVYVMILCASDGYANPRWLERCADALDHDPELSLVWGIPLEVDATGKSLGPHFLYGHFLPSGGGNRLATIRRVLAKIDLRRPRTIIDFLRKINPFRISAFSRSLGSDVPPEKQAWFSYWLRTGLLFPDGNMCMRRRVFDLCMEPYAGSGDPGDWMLFYFRFNEQGFLARCIPEIANFARLNPGQISEVWQSFNDATRVRYYEQMRALRARLARDPRSVRFQDGSGRFLNTYADAHH